MHAASTPAETIVTGADVVTMDDAHPSAEAVAISGGRVLAAGSASEVAALKDERTRIVDLHGKALLPGFIDGHSHFFQVALVSSAANVSAPPVGKVSTIAEIVASLKEHAAAHSVKPGEWLMGFGYDGSALRDGREATRDDLDVAFPETPVVVVHVSAHGALLNSAALKLAGIDATTPTPVGGVIARKPGSNEPTGLLMETAWLPVIGMVPKPSPKEALESIARAQMSYAANGYTTAQDAPAIAPIMALYEEAARQGRLSIDLVAYADSDGLAHRIDGGLRFPTSYSGRLRIGGVKLILDGSPQGKTAYFTQPYLTDGPNGEKNYRGAPVIGERELKAPSRSHTNTARKCFPLQRRRSNRHDARSASQRRSSERYAHDHRALTVRATRSTRAIRRLRPRRFIFYESRVFLGRRAREESRQRACPLLESDEDCASYGNPDVGSQRLFRNAARPALHCVDRSQPSLAQRRRHRS